MNRSDIQRLLAIRSYPAVSILLPTHRTSPENGQDPIRLKNLLTTAEGRLRAEFPRREIEPLLARLTKLASEIDYRSTLDSLALFVSRDFAAKFYLPFGVRERVVIDETFATRDLVFALNRSPRYWVLVLSEKPTRLYEGSRDALVEIKNHSFPLVHEGPGGAAPLPGGFGVRRSAHRDEAHRQFFRLVDTAFAEVAAGDPLPLIVVGVDRYLAFFDEVAKHKTQIVARLTGSHDKTPPHDLVKRVWPLMRQHLARQRQKALDDLEAAVGARRTVSGIGEAWRMAKEGRGATLLVEQDFHFPARVHPSGFHLTPADDPAAPEVIDDAVDEVIEVVLTKGGQVVFVENGALAEHQRIALILRY
jgi:hypothetical protein